MVVIEGRRMLCWSCKQLGHLARTYSQKMPSNNSNNDNHNKEKATSPLTKPTLEPGDNQKQSRRRMDPGYQKKEIIYKSNNNHNGTDSRTSNKSSR